eukprot:UN10171
MDLSCINVADVRYGQLNNVSYAPSRNMLNTFFATAIDLSDPYTPYVSSEGPVHPRFKVRLSERLANASFNVVYGDKEQYYGGPFPIKAIFNGSESNKHITITFSNMGEEGILIKNSIGFELYDITIGWFDAFDRVTNNGLFSVDVLIPMGIKYSNVTMTRYNFYTVPCLPYHGIENCALYDKQYQLPALPFIINISMWYT